MAPYRANSARAQLCPYKGNTYRFRAMFDGNSLDGKTLEVEVFRDRENGLVRPLPWPG